MAFSPLSYYIHKNDNIIHIYNVNCYTKISFYGIVNKIKIWRTSLCGET